MPLAPANIIATPASMADFTQPGLVLPHLLERDPAGIISELSHALQREGCLPDVLPFYHAALNQEWLGNSALDCGLAFPHARNAGVKKLQFAFGRAPEPVTWGPKGSRLVQLVVLVAIPATDSSNYLSLLAAIARLAQQPESLAELRAAETPELVLSVLRRMRTRNA
jgi:fructose PTS system EIIBC or EIIC component